MIGLLKKKNYMGIQMIEKEIKLLLTKSQYDIIDKSFEWKRTIIQNNHYYGTLLLENSEYTIRIREIAKKMKLQVKVPIDTNSSLHIKKEYEKEVNDIPKCLSKEQLKSITNIDLVDVSYLGKLTTERKVCFFSNDVELCLDSNIYLEHCDYELEIEYKEDYPIDIIKKLSDLGIFIPEKSEGKYTRFIKKLKKEENIV